LLLRRWRLPEQHEMANAIENSVLGSFVNVRLDRGRLPFSLLRGEDQRIVPGVWLEVPFAFPHPVIERPSANQEAKPVVICLKLAPVDGLKDAVLR
jgi:hypothetical protein